MKRLFILALIIAAGILVYLKFFKNSAPDGPSTKEIKMVVKTHSNEFNAAVDNVVAQYLSIKNAFVEADSISAKTSTQMLIAALDSIPLAELDSDKVAVAATARQSIADIKANANSLLQQPNITEMRRDFNMVTQMMYPSFFQSINYEGKKLYFDYCPMAFNDTEGANWLSDNEEIVNPYLGKHHPKYKGGMLGCGEVKDSVELK